MDAWRGEMKLLHEKQPAMQLITATNPKVHWRDVYDEEIVSGLSDLSVKKVFLIKMGRYLYEYGCPVKRIETALAMVASAMNVQGNFAIIPGQGGLKSPTGYTMDAWRGEMKLLHEKQPAMQLITATNPKVHWRDVYDEEIVSGLSDLSVKKVFLIKMGRYLYEYGCPVKRIETALAMVASAMNVQGNFAIIPGLLIASIGSSEKNHEESQTLTVKMSKSLDLHRLHCVEDIVRGILKRREEITMQRIYEDLDMLDNISSRRNQLYPRWMRLLAYGVFSAFSVGFFGGSWPEALISFALGLTIVGGFSEVKVVRAIFGPLLEFLAAVLISFTSQALASIPLQFLPGLQNQLCFWSMALSSACWTLPGLSITTAVMELSNGSLVSGAVNLFYAVILAIILGFGIAIGSTFVLWTNQANLASTCPQVINFWFNALFIFPIWNLSMYILLHAAPGQWPSMLFVTFVGYSVNQVCSLTFQSDTAATALSAFVMTLLAFVMHRVRRQIHVVPLILSGIMFLLPGGLGVRGASSLARSDIGSGNSLGLQVVQTALSITVGIFSATPFMQMFKLRRTKLSKKTSNAEIF
eukprot:TRINITY_DN3761_c0_g2_i1.p1 TRINITY_DN3761_c0_g2~~TRINITY_DN3761_c0_g2_i1.p1  ORF type:complete len:624 (+),score=131.34 TRINITY_DN3761_c0_g2_i1:127-1872(+)